MMFTSQKSNEVEMTSLVMPIFTCRHFFCSLYEEIGTRVQVQGQLKVGRLSAHVSLTSEQPSPLASLHFLCVGATSLLSLGATVSLIVFCLFFARYTPFYLKIKILMMWSLRDFQKLHFAKVSSKSNTMFRAIIA